MLSLSQITTITVARGNARSTWSSRAMKPAAQRRPSRYTHAPVLISTAPGTVTLRFVPGGENPRAQAAQRPVAPHMRQQVQVRLVLGQHHRAARQPGQPGHDARSSCAKIAASTLSFFSLAEAIALHRSGCTRCASNP
jgi:hypothetical protein